MAHHESSGSPLLALISHPPFTHTHSSSHSSSHSQSHSRSFSSASASEPVPASAPTPAVRSFSGGYTSTGTQKFSTAISGPSPSRSVSASLTHLQPGQHHYTSHVHTSPQHRHPQNLSQNSHPAYADSNNSLQQPLLHYQRSRSRSPRPHSPLRYQQTSSSSSLDISTNNCHTKTASTSNSTHTRHLSLHNNYSTYSPSHNRGYGHASSSSASLPQYNSGYGYGFSSANTASTTTGTLSSRKMGAHSHSPSQLREVTPITIDDFSSANTSQLSLSTSASGFDNMGAHGHKHRGHGPEKISGDFVDDHGSSHDDTHKNEGGHGNSCSHDHKHDHKHDHGHDHHHHDHHHHDHKHGHDHDHDHVHFHAHARSSMDDKSRVTKFLLGYTSSYPFLNAIMIEKDSRRILYYMLLNISFMMVQAFYGYVTDSLGLLSDTVHMFFDCMALLVGLVASVLGKRPPSQRFPYGLGKIETLSGFANGILLVLLSVEITFEAFERIWEGTETKRLGELLAVSVMGMVVNLVGMFAFGHHHHGHSHGGHDHSHGDGGCGGHDNENMQGIYLHVLADTLGSASVVVSTLLTYFTGHSFWDQLASVFISVLILGSSKPLIMSAARRLLLGIPDNIEYNLRNTLSGIAQQRGVLAYSVPKFWMDDRLGRENRLLGFVHVVAVKGASLEDVRDRVQNYLSQHNMDIVVQVEREGDASCWCDIGRAASGLALANASSL